MLYVEHVTKDYGKTRALNDVSLHLEPGTVTVLLGPNGAGKSTLMKAIMGLLRYDGEIHLQNLSNKSTEARARMGYIPELPSFYPNLTVSEHMEFLARVYKLTEYKDRMNDLLDRFELTDKKKKFGDELSKGMQQKLNLCLGLLPDPELLLLDEPMIGLDPHAIKQLKLVLDEMRAQGKTMLISTHIIDSVDMLWDQCLIMQGGELRAQIWRADLERSGRTLEDCFFEVTEGIVPEDMRGQAEGELPPVGTEEAEAPKKTKGLWGR